MRYDYLIFIGRFQPFHIGHKPVIEQALAQSHKVIVLIGSANQPRTVRNPWDFNERERMIRCNFSDEENKRILISPLQDYTYNNTLWIKSVQLIVSGLVHSKIASKPLIGLIGYSKDHTSKYLDEFPQWERVEVEEYKDIHATNIRESYFALGEIGQDVTTSVAIELEKFMATKAYKQVADEYHFINKYKSAWDASPYTPMFVTVDAVVVQSGHILLIERKAQPGKGLMALPGGFLDPTENLQEAVIRELREETRIKVPAPVLAGSISTKEVFDDPHRSARGRTITHAYLIELSGDKLPKVKGGDDASQAFWVAYADVKPEQMFEDHFHIIQAMVG